MTGEGRAEGGKANMYLSVLSSAENTTLGARKLASLLAGDLVDAGTQDYVAPIL
jgi:hypothetical protein